MDLLKKVEKLCNYSILKLKIHIILLIKLNNIININDLISIIIEIYLYLINIILLSIYLFIISIIETSQIVKG